MGAIDVKTLAIYGDPETQTAYAAPIMTKGDIRRFEFQFWEEDSIIPLKDEDMARLHLLGPSNQVLSSATGIPSGIGEHRTYLFDLPLVSPAIDNLFSGATSSVNVQLIVTFTYQGRHSTVPPQATLLLQSFASAFSFPPPAPPDQSGRATFEQAVAGINNTTWMTPLRTREAIIAFGTSGGGTGSFDPTNPVPFVTLISPNSSVYQLSVDNNGALRTTLIP